MPEITTLEKLVSPDFEFLDEEPEPPQGVSDTEVYHKAKVLLEAMPGKWAQVKTFDNLKSAGAKASYINRGKDARFPRDEYEARHNLKEIDGKRVSVLYLMKKPNPLDGTGNSD